MDIDRLKDALGRTLHRWPIVAGRFLVDDGEHYVIDMSDNPIPVSFCDNIELARWSSSTDVVHDAGEGCLQPFLDEVKTEELQRSSTFEPLFPLESDSHRTERRVGHRYELGARLGRCIQLFEFSTHSFVFLPTTASARARSRARTSPVGQRRGRPIPSSHHETP